MMRRRKRDPAELKNYLYVSDSKVDMLYAQIPAPLRDKIAVELKIDLRLFSASVRPIEQTETRYSKLRLVTRYLEWHLPMGTVDEPGTYFRGRLPMRWGPLGSRSRSHEQGPFTLFAFHEGRKYLALVGSSSYVTGGEDFRESHQGQSRLEQPGAPRPSSYNLVQVEEYIDNSRADLEQYLLQEGRLDQGASAGPPPPEADPASAQLLQKVNYLVANFRGPIQELEFIAVRLLSGALQTGTQVVLGTPLYVALH
jgi:hypothetical protein